MEREAPLCKETRSEDMLDRFAACCWGCVLSCGAFRFNVFLLCSDPKIHRKWSQNPSQKLQKTTPERSKIEVWMGVRSRTVVFTLSDRLWGALGRVLGRLGSVLGASWRRLGGVLGRLGGVFGAS